MSRPRKIVLLIAMFLPACATVDESPEPAQTVAAATAAEPPTATPTPTQWNRRAPRFAPAKDISVYKSQVAQRIASGHAGMFSGELPPILKSIVVLDLTVDRDGRVSRVAVSRSNGFKDLERVALQSVRRVDTFPAPTSAVLNGKPNVRYLETWLFREDGKFQIRSLVTAPQPGAEKLASAG